MTSMDEVKGRLEGAGLQVSAREVNDNQWQLEVDGFDGVVNVWPSTGTCQVQGRDKARLEELLVGLVGRGGRRAARGTPSASAAPGPSGPKNVFVVYGHDTVGLTETDAMLRRWGLEPLILDQLPSHGDTIIEKLEHYQRDVEWAVVLLTPDDLGHPALDPTKSAPRPRQNVVLEMGMLLGKLGRQHVAMLYKQSDPPMELPSDIQGYIYIPYITNVNEAGQQLAKEMAAAGFHRVPVERLA